jgi:hypothetical protein
MVPRVQAGARRDGGGARAARARARACGAALAALALLLPGTAAGAQRWLKVAVVRIDAPPALRHLGLRLADAVAKQAARAGPYQVLGPEAIARALGPEAEGVLAACAGEPRCLAEGAAPLGVDTVVGGRLELVPAGGAPGARYRLRLVHAEVRGGERIAEVVREVPVGAPDLVPAAVAATAPLVAGAAPPTGLLRVEADVPGARVEVDGEPAGEAPGALRVLAGRRRVTVSCDRCAPGATFVVEVPAGGEALHRARLFPLEAEAPPPHAADGGAR